MWSFVYIHRSRDNSQERDFEIKEEFQKPWFFFYCNQTFYAFVTLITYFFQIHFIRLALVPDGNPPWTRTDTYLVVIFSGAWFSTAVCLTAMNQSTFCFCCIEVHIMNFLTRVRYVTNLTDSSELRRKLVHFKCSKYSGAYIIDSNCSIYFRTWRQEFGGIVFRYLLDQLLKLYNETAEEQRIKMHIYIFSDAYYLAINWK